MTAPDPAWIEAGAKALADEGGLPGSSIHSWRCEYPDRYGPCDCVPQTVAEILAAVEPLIREQIAEEIAQAIERKHVDAMAQYRMERSTYWEGSTDAYDTAARIARQIGGAS